MRRDLEDDRRELVQRMVLAELLARRGEGPLARRVLLTAPRGGSAQHSAQQPPEPEPEP